jgi:ADP-heptose:LPS heptosyltransferase
VRILVYRLGSLGDTVVALPCFRRIRGNYPQAKITVLTNFPVSGKAAPLASILEHTGLIDEVIPYPVGLRDPRELAQLRRTIAREKFDLAVSLTAARGWLASLRDYLFFCACGIPRIVGIPWRRRDLVCEVHDGLYENEADRLLRRVASLPPVPSENEGLALTADELQTAARLLRDAGIRAPFLAASVGTKSPLKDWGAENWRELLALISRDAADLGLVLLGSPDERDRSDELAEVWRGPHANFCGQTTPRQSAAVLREAQLFIGHDSGPMHLAAAVGTRCVSVYSAQSRPGQWFPRGANHLNFYPRAFFDPHRLEDVDYQHQAITSISVVHMLSAVKSCLS